MQHHTMLSTVIHNCEGGKFFNVASRLFNKGFSLPNHCNNAVESLLDRAGNDMYSVDSL